MGAVSFESALAAARRNDHACLHVLASAILPPGSGVRWHKVGRALRWMTAIRAFRGHCSRGAVLALLALVRSPHRPHRRRCASLGLIGTVVALSVGHASIAAADI